MENIKICLRTCLLSKGARSAHAPLLSNLWRINDQFRVVGYMYLYFIGRSDCNPCIQLKVLKFDNEQEDLMY